MAAKGALPSNLKKLRTDLELQAAAGAAPTAAEDRA
jgi:hypothetical protein